MLESSFRNLVAAKRLPHPFVTQLRRFTTSLIKQGYADCQCRRSCSSLRILGSGWNKTTSQSQSLRSAGHRYPRTG
jgi:hypothetical protein